MPLNNPVSNIAGPNDNQLLFKLTGANLQSTSDQQFTKIFSGTRYAVRDVYAIARTGGATVTCAGGVYTGVGKTGDQIVSVAQSWVLLSAANKLVVASLNTGLTDSETATPFLSLTTGSTAAVTADFYIFGAIMD